MKYLSKLALIGGTVALSLSLSACSSVFNKSASGGTSLTNKTSKSKRKTQSTDTEEVEAETEIESESTPSFYEMGDTTTVDRVSYTLKSVKLTSYRNPFADKNPKYVIKIIYHIKNNTNKDIPIGMDLDAYGPDNNKLETYPVDDITLNAVASGKEADVVAGFGTDKLGAFEFQFSPITSFNSEPAVFIVDIQ